jgi:hypothetical protein
MNVAANVLILSILNSSVPYNILGDLGYINGEPAHNFANQVPVEAAST